MVSRARYDRTRIHTFRRKRGARDVFARRVIDPGFALASLPHFSNTPPTH